MKQNNGENIEYFGDEDHKKGCCKNINFTPFVLMIALSFHSIFEGLALGLQTNA